jgi:cell division protein FtsB
MRDDKMQTRTSTTGSQQRAVPRSLTKRTKDFVRRVWPPVLSVAAVAVTLWLGWQAVYEKDGLSAWQQKRAEEKQLLKENNDLQQENARMRDQIERLKSDPDAIGIVARGTMNYIKPNEVIVTLPPEQHKQAQLAGTGK